MERFQSPELAQCPIGTRIWESGRSSVGFNRLNWRNALQVKEGNRRASRERFNRLNWRNALQGVDEQNLPAVAVSIA